MTRSISVVSLTLSGTLSFAFSVALSGALAFGLALVSVAFAPQAQAAPAPEPWAFWQASNDESDAVIDHSLWQSVLDAHLKPSDDGVNRFAYKDLAAAGSTQLDDYLAQMAKLDPREYNLAEQQAFWINVYNALTVKEVLKYPSKKSILRMGAKFFAIGPWDDKVYKVAGEDLSLNDIEHRILRPIYKDQRVHYAVNCASIGCPNLGGKVFTGAGLDAQLTAAEENYLSHERGVTFTSTGRLKLSQIFEWYGSDFADDEEGVVAYIAEHHPTLGDKIKAYDGRVKYDYDWDLNTAN